MKKNWPLLFIFFCLIIFFYPLWLNQKIIGPFDFLVNWCHPYKSLDWSASDALYTAYLQFKTYLMSDVVTVVFPLKHFALETLKQGQIPLWNPYFLSGAPHLANTQAGVFNPFNFWFLLLGYQNGFNPYIVTQTILASIFMYLFLRSLKLEKIYSGLGAVTYALSGYFIVWLPWGTLGYAYLYLPLTLFLINRYLATKQIKFFLGSAFSLALSFYSGHIQTSVAISIAVYCYLLFWRVSFKTIVAHGLLVLAIAAPQLLPTAELLKFSARSQAASTGFYQEQTSSLYQLFNNFAPDFFGNPVTRNWWGQNNYAETVSFVGTIFSVLLFINLAYLVFAKKLVINNRYWLFFNLLLLIGFLLSTRNPVSYLVFKLKLPLFSSSTFSRYLSLFSFSQIIIGIYTLRQLFKEKQATLFRLIGFSAILITLIWLITYLILPKSILAENVAVAKRNLLLPSAIAGFFLGLVWFRSYLSSRFQKKIVPLLLVVVLGVQLFDLFRFGHKYLPFSPREFFYPNTPLTTYASHKVKDGRFYGNLEGNLSMLYRAKSVVGADPLYNLNYAQLLFSSKTGKPEVKDRGSVYLPDGPYAFKILNILGVTYIFDELYIQLLYDQIRPAKEPDFYTSFPQLDRVGIYNVHRNPFAAKMVYFIPENKVQVLPEGEKTIAHLLSSDFNPQQMAVINHKLTYNNLASTTIPKKNLIKINSEQAQKWQLKVSVTKPGLLIINQTYFPNWQATVNQQKVKIIKVNHALQAIALKPGVYQVVLKYQDKEFTLGVILFLGALLLSGFLALKQPRKNNR